MLQLPSRSHGRVRFLEHYAGYPVDFYGWLSGKFEHGPLNGPELLREMSLTSCYLWNDLLDGHGPRPRFRIMLILVHPEMTSIGDQKKNGV